MIENYRNLLLAIFNSDENKERKSAICVYDTFENDMLIGVFTTAIACGKFFNTNRNIIDCNICRKELRCRRYRLERVNLW